MRTIEDIVLGGRSGKRRAAITTTRRRLLVVAGAGAGKTDVMARRVAWWVCVKRVPRERVAAFTFTESAAEELKFRIRKYIAEAIGEDAPLSGMYVGTIHGFCLQQLRRLKPASYHNYDVIDEAARLALVQQGFHTVLGLAGFQRALSAERKANGAKFGIGVNDAASQFLNAYDLLNEYDVLDVELPSSDPPDGLDEERDWCKQARLRTRICTSQVSRAFGECVARYYAYMRCCRFLDFSTSQSELTRLLREDRSALLALRKNVTHLVVDEVQDLNPVQCKLVELIVGDSGRLTAVGDHRQAIYAFRGSRVDIMGELHAELRKAKDGEVVELEENYRSTPRIIDIANDWADTISPVKGLSNPRMSHGRRTRLDESEKHVALVSFQTCEQEAEWIASRILQLVNSDKRKGAFHDSSEGERGITFSDIAVLLRSSTSAKSFQERLRVRGIPVVVRAGPDLLSQPEVLLFLGCLARIAGIDEFKGSEDRPGSFPHRCKESLGVQAIPEQIVRAACRSLADEQLPVAKDLADRLLLACDAISARLAGEPLASERELASLRAVDLRKWLRQGRGGRRRVFPQQLLHFCLAEAEIGKWQTASRTRTETALYHVGQLSQLVKGIETPGWVPADGFKYRILALAWWGSRNARPGEAPLLVAPDAVTITTVHGAKGLEWPAVFLADVRARRFPSQWARSVDPLPFNGAAVGINPTVLADNENYDNERRLMYVALTRAQRYLYVTRSGDKTSRFVRQLDDIFRARGGTVASSRLQPRFRLLDSVSVDGVRLATSFSDLRYFLECPTDFYLRKVLGFAPGIEESFGYGRGVHNLLREIHENPRVWASIAKDKEALKRKLQSLIDRGLMYLRYTTGEPARLMKEKAKRVVADYIDTYADELAELTFEPEREFETLIPEADTLISGAIDVVRRDDPPRVTLVDFKSGHEESDAKTALAPELMRLQLTLYALAAKHELEYEPNRGLVRYLDPEDETKRERPVNFDADTLRDTRTKIVSAVQQIRLREFGRGPISKVGQPARCEMCDYGSWCGRRRTSKAARL